VDSGLHAHRWWAARKCHNLKQAGSQWGGTDGQVETLVPTAREKTSTNGNRSVGIVGAHGVGTCEGSGRGRGGAGHVRTGVYGPLQLLLCLCGHEGVLGSLGLLPGLLSSCYRVGQLPFLLGTEGICQCTLLFEPPRVHLWRGEKAGAGRGSRGGENFPEK
jgi:hypothetical protein